MSCTREVFEWQKALDTNKKYFVPPVSFRVIGKKFIMLSRSHDNFPINTILTLHHDDNSSAPNFTSPTLGTYYVSWSRVVPV